MGWMEKEKMASMKPIGVVENFSDGRVYTAEGIDIVELDDKGKIVYLENVPKNPELFQRY
ncbi:hypothetical protein ACEQPO_28450 [Bacillus sp. SL00103]